MAKQSQGAIWKKQTSKGEVLSITIDGKRYTAWPNTYKKEAKEPDYRIYLDEWKPTQKPDVSHTPKTVDNFDDMPF